MLKKEDAMQPLDDEHVRLALFLYLQRLRAKL